MATEAPIGPVKYQYDVKMTCGGCSSAVTRALTKILPADQFEVDLSTQTVKIFNVPGRDMPSFATVTEKIGKTGKEIIKSEEITSPYI